MNYVPSNREGPTNPPRSMVLFYFFEHLKQLSFVLIALKYRLNHLKDLRTDCVSSSFYLFLFGDGSIFCNRNSYSCFVLFSCCFWMPIDVFFSHLLNRVVAYLSRVLEAAFTALEGLNKQAFLTELVWYCGLYTIFHTIQFCDCY